MKIAVASEGNLVTQHFGHCANFNIFDIKEGKITGSISMQNGDHAHGCVPDFLTESGVKLIITGGIGGGAVENLKRKGIEVITGASGDAKAAAETYLSGALKSTGVLCSEHDAHHGHGHEGHQCGGQHGEHHQCQH